MRWLLGILLVVLLGFGALFVAAGRTAPPLVTIEKPARVVGQTGTLEVAVAAPAGRLSALSIDVAQNGHTMSLFSLGSADRATVTQVDPDHVRITRPLGKRSVPDLQQGAARITVRASRKSFLDLRTLTTAESKDIQVQLEPPRVAVLSTRHYVNLGGSEMVVYRATPADVRSGVRVGDIEYLGYPAPGAAADSGEHIAFFALRYDQDLQTPIVVFARDEAGNETTAPFVDKVFPTPQKRSTITIDDAYINRVVPPIIAHSPELKMAGPSGDNLADFLKANRDLRRINADEIAAMAAKTAPTMLWHGPFVQLGNSKVEASFADHRTYMYKGREVDREVHLGFDLAVTAHTPVVAANDGVVLNASWLGIYGNCVVIDHGMGVQSLYGHLQSFDVKVGDHVTRGQQIGRTDSTGLAGGDHLHFTMLVDGQMVNPVEWWDPHWIQDRIVTKLNEAGVQSR